MDKLKELEEFKNIAYNLEYKNKTLERDLKDAMETITKFNKECQALEDILFFVKCLYIITLIFVIVNTF